jgi:chemotaxis protein MotB
MTKVLAMLTLLTLGCVPKTQHDQLQQQFRQLKKKANSMANAQLEVYNELKEDLSSPINRGIVDLSLDEWGRIVVGVSSDVLFESGSSVLSESGRQEIAKLGRILARSSDRVFRIEGHTDRNPIATEQFPNNWYLGSARAIVVLEQLVASGLSPRQLSAGSHADNRPVGRVDANNRRIEIVVEPDLTEMPGYQRIRNEAEEN